MTGGCRSYGISLRVRRFTREEFARDFRAEVDARRTGALDRDTGKPAAPGPSRLHPRPRLPATITVGDSSSTAFSPEQRTFQFADGLGGAEAWLRLSDKYGSGQNVIGMLTGHLNKMATDIALAEVVGPNHGAIMRAALKHVSEQEAGSRRSNGSSPVRMLESASVARRTYDVLTGRASAVEGPLMSGIFGGLRSINVAAKLGGAVISAVPGDSVTAGLAAMLQRHGAGPHPCRRVA